MICNKKDSLPETKHDASKFQGPRGWERKIEGESLRNFPMSRTCTNKINLEVFSCLRRCSKSKPQVLIFLVCLIRASFSTVFHPLPPAFFTVSEISELSSWPNDMRCCFSLVTHSVFVGKLRSQRLPRTFYLQNWNR